MSKSISRKAKELSGLTVEYVGGGLWVGASHWGIASAQLRYALKEDASNGVFHGTPFQVGDVHHSSWKAGVWVRDWLKSEGGV